MIELKEGQLYLYECHSAQYIIKILELGNIKNPKVSYVYHTIEVLESLTIKSWTEPTIAIINPNIGTFKPITKEVYNTLYKGKV